MDVIGHSGSIDVEIYDLSGRLLQTINTNPISLKNYAKGIYIFRVEYGNRVEELKVVKK